MESEPVFASFILDQLRSRNAAELAFSNVFTDYQTLMKRNRELQVRNGQLDKEANELRNENSMLSQNANMSRLAEANVQEVAQLKAECKKLQDQVNQLFEEKSKLAEKLLTETEQLRIVRENFNQQDKALTDSSKTIKDLKSQKKDLQGQVEMLHTAQNATAEELQARVAENESSAKRIRDLETDNKDISTRLVEMKEVEIERMNEVNRICNEMMQNARNMERAAAAEAQSGGKMLNRLFGSKGFGNSATGMPNTLVDQLKDITMRSSITDSKVPSGRAKTTFVHEGGCYALVFDRSGARLASAGADKVVRLWEPSSATQTGQLHGMQELVTDLCFNCDQNHLLAAGSDKSIRMFNIESGRVRHTLTGHTDKVSSVSCDPVDEKMAASGGMDRTIKTWDLHRGFVSGSFIHASRCHSVRFTMDGAMLASGHMNGNLCFWDKRSHKSVHEVAGLHAQQIVSLAMGSRTGMILSCGKDHLLKLVDMRTYQVKQTMRAPGFTVNNTWCSATIAADEKHVASGSVDGQVFIWETDTGTLKKSIGGGRGAAGILASCWSPQGTPLVSSDRVGAVSFWE